MIPITEVRSASPALRITPRSRDNLFNAADSTGILKKRRKLAKTPRATEEEILNSRLKNTRVKLNVGGECHEVMWKTLKRMPFTRLGLLSKALNHDQIMELCDDYNLEKNEYYFDRHPKSFLCVLTMFRTGSLHMLEDLCIVNFAEDLEYWGINENLMESCCHHRYHMKRERINEEMKKIRDIHEESNQQEQWGAGKFNQFRRRVWDLMENPQTSMAAQVIAVVSVVFILISITCLTLSTLPAFQGNETAAVNSSRPGIHLSEPSSDVQRLETVEVVCIIWFSFEYLSRLFACPDKRSFMKSPMNMIDLLAILPYYISVIFTKAFSNQNMDTFTSARKILQVFRILRVLRILKLARHSTGLQALGYTLQKSYKELGMLVMFIALGVLLFSSLIYFAEKEENGKMFSSIPATFWWAIITMTTVGYGDMYPKTDLGKFIGSFCCICGVLVIALPIPIIVNNFADYYKDQLRREKTLKRKEDLARAKQSGSILSSRSGETDSYNSDFSDEDNKILMKSRPTRSQSLKPVSINEFSKDPNKSPVVRSLRSKTVSSSDILQRNTERSSFSKSNHFRPCKLLDKPVPKVSFHNRQTSIPLVETQIYKMVHSELAKKIEEPDENDQQEIMTEKSDEITYKVIPITPTSNSGEEKDTFIEILPDDNKSNFRQLLSNIMPKSYSSSYLKYVPTKSL